MSLYDKASLVMIPSGYKDDKLYSIKPTSGDGDFTFSRDGSGASPATRVNSAGLIEKGRTNLLLQSNQFDTTWTNNNSTETSGQSGYDGTNDAWLLNSVGSGSAYATQSVSSSGVKTLSVYAKAGTADWVIVQMAGGTASYTWFDLTNGLIGTEVNVIESKIESVGGGWYRCSITGANSNTSVNIYVATANNSTSTSSGDNIYIQDAQLEKGLVATSYIETTTAAASAGILGDMPRLDYSGGATCPSLLLEPSRVNIIDQSEYINGWNLQSGIAVSDNQTTSPEGLQNAGIITAAFPNSRAQKNLGTLGSNYIFSAFVKSDGVGTRMELRSNVTGNNLILDVAASGEVTHFSDTAVNNNYDIENYGNGWYRVWFEGATDGASSNYYQIYPDVQFGNRSVYVWGIGMELGSYPTSYVPTYGSATARAADSCSVTGVSDVIGQTEGTLFLDYETDNAEDSGRLIAIGDGSTNNRILLRNQGSGTLLYVAAGGSSTWSTTYYTPGNTGRIKIALAYANNDGILFVNGSSVNSDTSVTIPTCSNVYIGTSEYGGSESVNMLVHDAVLFNERLTNSELATLTTL